MALENIIGSIIQATGRTRPGRMGILESAGLHFTDPERYSGSPGLRATGSPVSVAEGFRGDRYINSALFHERGYELVTSVTCSLPAFICDVRLGVPRVIKSPVTLPLEILKRLGTAVIVSDGSRLSSRRYFRRGTRPEITLRQIGDIELLESLITAI